MPTVTITFSWKKVVKRGSFIFILLALAISLFYIFIYDNPKNNKFFPIKADAGICMYVTDKLPPMTAAKEKVISYNKGFLKSIMVISIKPHEGDVEAPPLNLYQYYILDRARTKQVIIRNWQYTSIFASQEGDGLPHQR